MEKQGVQCIDNLWGFPRRANNGGRMIVTAEEVSNLCKEERYNEALMAVDCMDQQGFPISRDIIYCLLQGCTKRRNLEDARKVHSFMINSRVDTIPVLIDHLIRLFASCGSLTEASQAFGRSFKPSLYTWNAIISAHVKLGKAETALELFCEMQLRGLKPDKITFLYVLKACGIIGATGKGRLIHCQVVSSAVVSDKIVGSALIDMYAKCGNLEEAEKIFDELPSRDVVSWCAIIAGNAQHGRGTYSIELYEKMQLEGIDSNEVICSSVLKACGSVGAIQQGKSIHDCVIRSGFDWDLIVNNSLVDMYAKCSSLDEAYKVFEKSTYRDAVLWDVMIAGHASHGHDRTVLELIEKVQLAGMKPTKSMLLSGLKACASIGAIDQARLIHGQLISCGLDSDVILGNALIDMYGKCASLGEGCEVFDQLLKQDVVSWGALMIGHAEHGLVFSVLKLFENMQSQGIDPDRVVFLCMLKAYGSMADIVQGRMIHHQIIKCNLQSDLVIGNTLVDMYAKCGSLGEACNIFDKLDMPDGVSWGAMIAGYAQHGHGLTALELLQMALVVGIKPCKVIFLGALKACCITRNVTQGMLLHEEIISSAVISDLVIQSALIDMYAKCESLEEACFIFDELPSRDLVSWAAIIAGYVEHGHGLPALELFEEMQQDGIVPNKTIFLCILKACCTVGDIAKGRMIHDQLVNHGLQSDLSIGNSLIDMYIKCQSLEEALEVFENLSDRDDMTWGFMIAGYVQNGYSLMSLHLFSNLQKEGLALGKDTFVCILKACGSIGAIEQGRFAHDQLRRCNFESDLVVGSTLVDMYVKCGSIEEARKVFDALPTQDLVSCSLMISGYVQFDHSLPALGLFTEMQRWNIKPDKFTFLCVLKACGSAGAIEQGRLIHDEIVENGLVSDAAIRSTLVDMYTKCGSLEDAHEVFDEFVVCDTISWGTIIAGHARRGNCKLAWKCLEDMQQLGLKPTDMMLNSILVACSHAGLLDEGHHYFKSMIEDYSITPRVEHYNCMIDLFSRAGRLKEAEDFLITMPNPPDIVGWRSLLTGCRTYGNTVLGRQCFNEVVQLKPKDASSYILMSNIYADAQMWEDVDEIQALRISAGAPKKAGRAWLEISNTVHEFIVGGKSHLQWHDTHAKLDRLSTPIKSQGFVPQVDICLQVLFDENNLDILYGQREGLTLALGLTSPIEGTSVRATSNLQVCFDCNNLVKFVNESHEVIKVDVYCVCHFNVVTCLVGDCLF